MRSEAIVREGGRAGRIAASRRYFERFPDHVGPLGVLECEYPVRLDHQRNGRPEVGSGTFRKTAVNCKSIGNSSSLQ